MSETEDQLHMTHTVFNKPKCLIEAYHGEFNVNKETLDEIETIGKPLVVVTIAGIYRTGKSYLLTRLAGKYEGFEVGNSIQSKTRGIWAWCVDHPLDNERKLLLLDTEGLGDIEKGDQHHDRMIFTIATLLSSALVFNATGAFNQDALTNLSMVLDFANNIQTTKTGGTLDTATEIDFYLPDFVLVVRDFFLDIVIDGQKMTADQYLEHCLTVDPTKNQDYNEPRLKLRKYFKRRKCFVMVQPEDHKKMKSLASLTDDELDEEFVEQVHDFIQHIYQNAKPFRTRNDTAINGRMFTTLVKQYVEAIKSRKVPVIDATMEAMAMKENYYIVQKAYETYSNTIEALELPTKKEIEFVNVHTQATAIANEIYLKGIVMDEKLEFKSRLNRMIQEKYSPMKERNKDLAKEVWQKRIRELHSPILRKLESGLYFSEDGLKSYEEDMETLQKEYETSTEETFMKDDILLEFLKESERNKLAILLKLNEEKKELEFEKFEKEKKEILERTKKTART